MPALISQPDVCWDLVAWVFKRRFEEKDIVSHFSLSTLQFINTCVTLFFHVNWIKSIYSILSSCVKVIY